MNQFFRDMLNALRLRFRPLEEYRYSPMIYVVILLLCGISSAAVMQWSFEAQPDYPLKFNTTTSLVAFSVCLVVLQWLSLSTVLSKMLSGMAKKAVPLKGYMLMTQAFVMFGVCFLYLPKEWVILASAFQMWTFWLQLYGLFFVAAPEVSGWKILLSYIASYGVFCLMMVAVGAVFLMTGQLDDTLLQQEVQKVLQEQQQSQ